MQLFAMKIKGDDYYASGSHLSTNWVLAYIHAALIKAIIWVGISLLSSAHILPISINLKQ